MVVSASYDDEVGQIQHDLALVGTNADVKETG